MNNNNCKDEFAGISEDIVESFSTRLRQVRVESGLTQQQFADEIGISVAALSYYETGKRVPDIVFLAKLYEYFLIPVDYFLGYTDSKVKGNPNISNKLHISDKAIDQIVEYNGNVERYEYCENIDVFNTLLENKEFYNVLDLIVGIGLESTYQMPDDEYIQYIVTKKMISIISGCINRESAIRNRIIHSKIKDKKEKEEYYEWLRSESEKRHNSIMEEYKKQTQEINDKINNSIDKFRSKNSIRLNALNNTKEVQNNGNNRPKEE